MRKQVWLNLATGEFSNSWNPERERELLGKKLYDEGMEKQIKSANETNWKLIEYECVNDPTFEFYGMMKIR
jgi:hypothetical protein